MSYLQSFKSHVIAIVFLLAWLVSTSPASAQGVREQIDELNSNWVVAFKSRDFAMIEALYMPDGILLPTGTPAIEGQKAIVSVWKP